MVTQLQGLVEVTSGLGPVTGNELIQAKAGHPEADLPGIGHALRQLRGTLQIWPTLIGGGLQCVPYPDLPDHLAQSVGMTQRLRP